MLNVVSKFLVLRSNICLILIALNLDWSSCWAIRVSINLIHKAWSIISLEMIHNILSHFFHPSIFVLLLLHHWDYLYRLWMWTVCLHLKRVYLLLSPFVICSFNTHTLLFILTSLGELTRLSYLHWHIILSLCSRVAIHYWGSLLIIAHELSISDFFKVTLILHRFISS